MTQRRLLIALTVILLVTVTAFVLPRLRAGLSGVPEEAGDQLAAGIYRDEAALVEASFLWDNPIEKLLIWDRAVVVRSPCLAPFTTDPLQGEIREGRTVEAYGPFGLTFSTVKVDCQGRTERS